MDAHWIAIAGGQVWHSHPSAAVPSPLPTVVNPAWTSLLQESRTPIWRASSVFVKSAGRVPIGTRGIDEALENLLQKRLHQRNESSVRPIFVIRYYGAGHKQKTLRGANCRCFEAASTAQTLYMGHAEAHGSLTEADFIAIPTTSLVNQGGRMDVTRVSSSLNLGD